MTRRSKAQSPPSGVVIPDYSLLKAIGNGAYGEVWLAKGLTGALRAVKIVRRSNFHEKRSFDKEFDGITNYEAVSRSHPALLEVLHVGRLKKPELYYYVMELADSYGSGTKTPESTEEYVPHTLSEEIRRKKRIDPARCVKIGKALAEGLAVLHGHHLTHRDLKPANVVFAGGRPMLADIGLVAVDGKSSFVGTEGFVPPEGPGSGRADIYSLGMVLYEASSGRDRLEFPRPPADIKVEDKQTWLGLNEVICRACDPNPDKRYRGADEMMRVLSRLEEGISPGSPRRRRIAAAGLLAVAVGLSIAGFAWLWRDDGPVREELKVPTPAPVAAAAEAIVMATPEETPLLTGSIKIVSSPPGASVYLADEYLDTTPLLLEEQDPGTMEFTLVLSGHRTLAVRGEVVPGEQNVVGGELGFWRPPVSGVVWENSVGQRFIPQQEYHLAESPVSVEILRAQLEAGFEEALASGDVVLSGELGLVKRAGAMAFCNWLTLEERRRGYLGPVQRYRPSTAAELEAMGIELSDLVLPNEAGGAAALYPVVETLPHGSVRIGTEPRGATVYSGEEFLGRTPLTIDQVAAGPVRFVLKLDGFEDLEISGAVRQDKELPFEIELTRTGALLFGQPWENSLGMKFIPIGDILVSVWETRVADYEAFCIHDPAHALPDVDFLQGPNHPIVKLTRREAAAFCEWLTRKDQFDGLLKKRQHYRLPTDREWSLAAGLSAEKGETPAERDMQITDVYPWGGEWPPPEAVANLADLSSEEEQGSDKVLGEFDDRFAKTAPVGSFAPNDYGLHDLAGNVWEWVADDYGAPGTFDAWGVVRGGSWSNYRRKLLWTSCRNLVKPDISDGIYGFRCVIAESEETR